MLNANAWALAPVPRRARARACWKECEPIGNDTEPGDLIRSVSRALRIMEEVSRSPRPLPVKVIARRCQLHLSTAYHLVRTLCYEGYLVRAAGRRLRGRFRRGRALPRR